MQGVKKLASVMVDLSVIPEDAWKVKRSHSNATYHKLSFSLEIAVQSSLEFSLVVDGENYGKVKAAYE